MTEEMALKMLRSVGAVITDSHIVYTSGLHGSVYVNKDAVYPHVQITAHLSREIAKRFAFPDHGIDVVVGPAMGGVIISQWVAYYLTKFCGREVIAVYADKEQVLGSGLWHITHGLRLLAGTWVPQLGNPPLEQFVLRRGYDKLVNGKDVLVVEDILTTGSSARKVVSTTRAAGGEVVALAALCNRGGLFAQLLNVPLLFSLTKIDLASWDEEECRIQGFCAKNVPINTDVGKGKEFLARIGKM